MNALLHIHNPTRGVEKLIKIMTKIIAYNMIFT